MLADFSIMEKVIQRLSVLMPEFHKKKKLPVDSNKLSYTIAFTSIQSADRLDRPSLY